MSGKEAIKLGEPMRMDTGTLRGNFTDGFLLDRGGMTMPEIIAAAALFELKNPPFPMRILVGFIPPGSLIIQLDATVLDRDSGAPMPLRFMIHCRMPYDAEELHWHMRECVHGFLHHEADEMILIDGVRIYDPHDSSRHRR